MADAEAAETPRRSARADVDTGAELRCARAQIALA
jgi:hypothetical protein